MTGNKQDVRKLKKIRVIDPDYRFENGQPLYREVLVIEHPEDIPTAPSSVTAEPTRS
jgi:hypothetical protein